MSLTTADGPDESHRVPSDTGPDTVVALGRLSEALETVERARGHLYSFHQLSGHADAQLADAVDRLRAAGHPALADRLTAELVGLDVLAGRWTFEVVEEYDDGYWSTFRRLEAAARDELAAGRRHLHEAGTKVDEQRAGHRSGDRS